MKTSAEHPLPDARVEQLLQALEPEAPPAEVAQRIRTRVLSRVAVDPSVPKMKDIRLADGWQPFGDVARMKVLNDDGETISWLAQLPAGCSLPQHDHEGAEECLVVSGDLWLNGERFGPGDYQFAAPGTRHDEVRSEGGCLLLVRSPSPQRASGRAYAG
jgi:anti-sigma factor ChrR (cupin superfamily)